MTAFAKEIREKLSGQDYMALHRIPVGRTTGKRDSEIPGRAGGRQVCGGEEGYCPEMERQFQPEVIDVQRSLEEGNVVLHAD